MERVIKKKSRFLGESRGEYLQQCVGSLGAQWLKNITQEEKIVGRQPYAIEERGGLLKADPSKTPINFFWCKRTSRNFAAFSQSLTLGRHIISNHPSFIEANLQFMRKLQKKNTEEFLLLIYQTASEITANEGCLFSKKRAYPLIGRFFFH